MKLFSTTLALVMALSAVSFPNYGAGSAVAAGPVETSHIRNIQELFSRNGLKEAGAGLDESGRVVLKGAYQDRREVDLAFSLAQTVVGAKWVSPVVPENIRVKEWEKALSQLFPTTGTRPQGLRPDTAPPARIARKYALVVGLSKFREAKIAPLKYAAKDANDFYTYLISPNGGNFRKENVVLLTDKKATKANIADALDNIRARAEKDDLVMLYFSSHGTPPNIYGSVNIVTYDSAVKPRQAIWDSSVTDEMLRDFILGVKAKRLLVVMDTCYSSGAYRQVSGFLPEGGKALGVEDEGQGMSKPMAHRLLGAKDLLLVDDPAPAEESGLSDGGWGRVLISASGPDEKSWESERLKNSFFTYHFLGGMKRLGNVRQAFDYARPRVTEDVLREKQEAQHPQAVADRKDWAVNVAR